MPSACLDTGDFSSGFPAICLFRLRAVAAGSASWLAQRFILCLRRESGSVMHRSVFLRMRSLEGNRISRICCSPRFSFLLPSELSPLGLDSFLDFFFWRERFLPRRVSLCCFRKRAATN